MSPTTATSICLAALVLGAGLVRPTPALAQSLPPASAPQAGLGGKVIWGGFGVEGYWAYAPSEAGPFYGIKGSAGLLGSPYGQVGALGGWRFPIGEYCAWQPELSLGVLYANSAIGGGGPMLRGWSAVAEPAARFLWQVSSEAWLGLFAACGLSIDGGGLMPLPAIGVSITTMRPR